MTVDDGTPGTIPYSASPAAIRRIIGVYIAAVDERSPGANTEGVQNSVTSAVRDDVVLPNRARDDAVKAAKAAKPPKRKRTFTSGAILTSSTYVDECVADKAEEAKAEEAKAAKAELKAARAITVVAEKAAAQARRLAKTTKRAEKKDAQEAARQEKALARQTKITTAQHQQARAAGSFPMAFGSLIHTRLTDSDSESEFDDGPVPMAAATAAV